MCSFVFRFLSLWTVTSGTTAFSWKCLLPSCPPGWPSSVYQSGSVKTAATKFMHGTSIPVWCCTPQTPLCSFTAVISVSVLLYFQTSHLQPLVELLNISISSSLLVVNAMQALVIGFHDGFIFFTTPSLDFWCLRQLPSSYFLWATWQMHFWIFVVSSWIVALTIISPCISPSSQSGFATLREETSMHCGIR